MRFEPNRGQTDSRVAFLAGGSGYRLFLTPGEAVFSLKGTDARRRTGLDPARRAQRPSPSTAVIRMRLVGGNDAAAMAPEGQLPGVTNYFLGRDQSRWITGVPGYAKVHYQGVYPGVDLVYYGQKRGVEYDFVVSPGADPNPIRLAIEGADSLAIDGRGDLVMRTPAGEIRHRKPFAYQMDGPRRVRVPASYALAGGGVSFRLGAYDQTRPLVIDPVISYAGYLGGSANDLPRRIAVDSSGNAYVVGRTASVDFPTSSAFQATSGGGNDTFVTKFSPSGSALVYSTYLGGSGNDEARAVAVDSSGNAYVAGSTGSANFPTVSPFQGTRAGTSDAFVAKLNPSGSSLLYSTYLGGSGTDPARGIAVDASANIYVAGVTTSTNFPTASPFQAANAGDRDGYVAKLNSAGSALSYSTYLGGTSVDSLEGLALDSSGSAYLAGSTDSTDYPTATPVQAAQAGTGDVFLTKLSPSGASLSYSTYLGGSAFDKALGVAVDAPGNAYLTGLTVSKNFPTANPIQGQQAGLFGAGEAFVTKVNAAGSALLYSTYLGGSLNEEAHDIAVDPSGNAYVTGVTQSDDFPVKDQIQGDQDDDDAFITKLNSSGSALVYSSYLLGNGHYDFAYGIAVDGAGGAYVTGETSSSDMPLEKAVQTTLRGGAPAPRDGFVLKVVEPSGPGAWSPTGNLNLPRFGHTSTLLQDGRVLATGGCATEPGNTGQCAAQTATAELFEPERVNPVTGVKGMWVPTAPMTTARAGHTATMLASGKVLVTGGCVTPSDLNCPGVSRSAEVFDPATGIWAPTGPMGTGRRFHTASLLSSGKVLLAGGVGDFGATSATAELFDPNAGSGAGAFTPAASLSQARSLHTATLLADGRVLLVGGSGAAGPMATAEAYDPVSGTFGTTGSLGQARSSHTATLLASGKVVVAGGTAGSVPLAGAEIYDPGTGAWAATGSLNQSRSAHAAAVLPGGAVLIAGGMSTSAGFAQSTAELYDPATGSWRFSASMGAARAGSITDPLGHTLTLLNDGTVLAAGGNASTLTERFRLEADLSVSMSDSPDPATLGEEITLTVTVTNHGPHLALGVALIDPLPSTVSLVSATPSQGGCANASGTLRCTLGDVANAASATVTIVVEPNVVGSITNTASASSGGFDPDPTNNTGSASTVVANTHGCTIIGTPGDDTLVGTNGQDVICGLGGNDSISGGTGDDRLIGGSGNDAVVSGGGGNDTLEGGKGDDLLDGGNGNDALVGGPGADVLNGNAGDDSLDGVDGVAGNDALDGGTGTDACSGDPGDTIAGCP